MSEGIAIAESTKAKKSPKVLDHLEIHPRLGGGHIIEHHYTGYQHEKESHKFSEDQGERAMKHIAKHAGLPHPELEEQGGSEPEEFD
jgi:hypothetical protein